MYVITVEFQVKETFEQQFLSAVRAQAKNSLNLEVHCHHFDVAVSDNDSCLVFLYELYTDKAAFDTHLASTHFIEFNALVANWVEDKIVSSWTLQD